ncbi:hypothetical protein niasHT_016615 [Heterodera trifolii]|uniref:Meckelin n=1 Tax=Heterodera trifolii TaxID=157864 RepID=A0ABD2LJT7_9BILA
MNILFLSLICFGFLLSFGEGTKNLEDIPSGSRNNDEATTEDAQKKDQKFLLGQIDEAKKWALANGLMIKHGRMMPFSLFPSPFPRALFDKAVDVQKSLQLLYFRAMRDFDFLKEMHRAQTETNEEFRQTVDFIENCYKDGFKQPLTLFCQRAGYMAHENEENNEKKLELKQHVLSMAKADTSPSALPPNHTDTMVAKALHMACYPYDKTVEVVMATACSVAALWAAMRAYSWGRRSGKLIIDASTILKLVLYAADGIGNIFLLVMAIISVWLTFAYKMQSHLFYVPLADSQEGSFVAYLVSSVALKALSLAHTLVCLTLVQTFFIDWERPRALKNTEQKRPIDEAKGEQKATDSQHSSVVIWRTYLIANEWNELQLYRKTRLSVQLLVVLFLLDYMEFGNFAKLQPGFGRVDQPSEVVETRMSRFAVDFSFYVAIAMCQWLFQMLIVERVTDPFRNFMDLCSVANISVLAMTNPLRGFYIHGRSVHGFADTDMLQMNVFLQRERDNLCAMRGLEMGSDLQTFVINVPRAFRERIDQIMATAVVNGKISAAAVRQGADAMDKTTVRMQQVATAYSELNECLKDFVNRVDPQCDYVITSPRLIEALLGLELSDTSTIGTFRRDRSECEYSSAFLYGNEWALLSAELALFCLVDLFWRHRLLAAFVTFLLSVSVRHTVKLYFTHQLAKSSMVDSRFLI